MKHLRHLRIGDLVMVDHRSVGSYTASCLPEMVWMKAGVICEINLYRARVQYDDTFFAWFDLPALHLSQGPELFRPDEVAAIRSTDRQHRSTDRQHRSTDRQGLSL